MSARQMSLPELDASEFGAFFRAVHDVDPFPWQVRLANLVCRHGWPDALDVPTGAGKTAAIDVAVFHLALEADRGAARRAAVRTYFVVDRRLVVDDAHARASRLATALARPESDVLRRVAGRLASLAESRDRPLVAVRLRGGVPRDPDWIRTPSQPTVVVSTVDQVGSRLFFRGYGVSDSMRPVHAALVGSDSLMLLDEAHLSQPFVQSATDARRYQERGPWSDDACPAPFRVATLSATQTADAPALVTAADLAHPVLGPRLRAPKIAELVEVAAKPEDDSALIDAVADRAWELISLGGGAGRVVGVVLNRVRRARAVSEILRQRAAAAGAAPGDVALLTGRTRPLDRERVLRQLLPRMQAQRVASPADAPLIVVATQCIEAGADLDFDALVTEVAPLDSLRQRFGRLNRMGRPIDAAAAVIAMRGQVAGSAKQDPVYGRALKATWALLWEKSAPAGGAKAAPRRLDFGTESSRRWIPSGAELAECLAPRQNAPVMLPAFIEQWSCTSPVPAADPEVSLFLHGPRSGPADVQVVWRADVEPQCDVADWIELLDVCPPSSLESMPVPIGEVRRWLRGEASGDVSDEEGAVDDVPEARGRSSIRVRALRWRGAEPGESRIVEAHEVRPGDLLVVAASVGGCDAWGWAPKSAEPVTDLGDEANLVNRGRDILRLSPQLAAMAFARESVPGAEVAASRVERVRGVIAAAAEESDADLLGALRASSALPATWASWLSVDGSPRVVRGSRGRVLALERQGARVEGGGVASTEDDRSSIGGLRAVTLDQHSRDVRDTAALFAERAGLPPRMAEDVALAAFLHDAGKAHPTFKLWLYGGDELSAIDGPSLAKSGRAALGPAVRERARLPKGARHEVASLAFAVAHPSFGQAHDPDLVLWLIGTHHGWGRPFFPQVEWPPPGTDYPGGVGDGDLRSAKVPSLAELTAVWLERHARLTRAYGAWGLARLEAVLRLADHRSSEAEQREAT